MLNRKGAKIGTSVHVYVQICESVYFVKLVSFFFTFWHLPLCDCAEVSDLVPLPYFKSFL